jgi:hypothetical protein
MRVGAQAKKLSLSQSRPFAAPSRAVERSASAGETTGSGAPSQPSSSATSGATGESEPGARPPRRRAIGWWVTFLVLAVTAIVAVGHYTGVEVLAASGRFLWNALAAVANGAMRTAGGLLAVIARGVGWRRLSGISRVVMGVGLSYAGGVILSDKGIRRAHGWRGKGRLLLARMRRAWLDLPLIVKLAIVAVLIASQVYLHVVLIIFPVAFLVPVVRRVWVQAADIALGSWYWKTFGGLHRRIAAGVSSFPGVGACLGAVRLTRLRYLTAWRLWRYHPRYASARAGRRRVDPIEPLRLWRRGELDLYVGRALLGGCRNPECLPGAAPPRGP